MNDIRWTIYESPFGPLTLQRGSHGLTALNFPGRGGPLEDDRRSPADFADVVAQMDEYFGGERRTFDLPLDLHGTEFQRAVWAKLLAIPYGETTTYGVLARALGRPDRARAIGAAVGRTPVAIIVPCHRVIGSDGSLTGYGGGLQRKATLLDLEARGVGGAAPPASWSMRQIALL
ncbi:MAG: methylated-DNA-[protein]-cysteine S-methyltransferase [Solirubrobacteraceae bacterium]|jgi:methylated-DNA-[protein]-cysteine S-methyltransferase|nr:methylated-DNA-[protein]-cysteine S-methyltransferase [Solirubrobacteraceae bacterium]